jgi:hypothetical protein
MSQESPLAESHLQATDQARRLPFQHLTGPEWDRLLSAASLLALVLYVGWIVVVGVSQVMGNDFLHYWNSNRTWILGGNPYEHMIQVEGDIHATTVFPLWMLLPFWPFALLPYELAVRIFFILNTLLLGCTIHVLKRLLLPSLSGWRWHLTMLFAVWLSVPALYSAQASVLVTLCLALSLTELKAQRYFQSGALLGLTLTKPHILFANWVLLPLSTWLRGQRRFVLGLASLVVLIVSVSAALLPGWWQPYLTGDFTWIAAPDQRAGDVLWPKSTWPEWASLVLGWQGWPVYALYGALALGLGIVVGYSVWWFLNRRLSMVTLGAMGIVVSLLLTPYAREYDYNLLVLPSVVIVALARDLGAGASRTAALGLLAVVLVHLRGGLMPWTYFSPLIIGSLLIFLVVAHVHRCDKRVAS